MENEILVRSLSTDNEEEKRKSEEMQSAIHSLQEAKAQLELHLEEEKAEVRKYDLDVRTKRTTRKLHSRFEIWNPTSYPFNSPLSWQDSKTSS